MTEPEWQKKEVLGITKLFSGTFVLLERVMQSELEKLEKKAQLLRNLQSMKEMDDG
jgi:hypothetical protein